MAVFSLISPRYMTWSPWCIDSASEAGMACCPMLWGWKQVDDFVQLVKPGYARYALGPNEYANVFKSVCSRLKKLLDQINLANPICLPRMVLSSGGNT